MHNTILNNNNIEPLEFNNNINYYKNSNLKILKIIIIIILILILSLKSIY